MSVPNHARAGVGRVTPAGSIHPTTITSSVRTPISVGNLAHSRRPLRPPQKDESDTDLTKREEQILNRVADAGRERRHRLGNLRLHQAH